MNTEEEQYNKQAYNYLVSNYQNYHIYMIIIK